MAILAPTGSAPAHLAADEDARLIVMSDLGSGPNLADAILGTDRALAASTLDKWAEAIAGLHRASTTGLRDDFAAQLSARAPQEPVDGTADMFARAIEQYVELLPALGLRPEPALGILAGFPDVLSAAEPVLSPTDACPDNNLLTGDALRLIDFEGAEVRHPAWDVSYLRVPWPSCWCSWAVPDQAVQQALARYRECLGSSYAATRTFDRDLDLATLGWSLMTPAWFLKRALGPEVGDDQDPRIPSRRSMIQHRLRQAAAIDGPRALTSFAVDLHAALVARWGEVELPLGPAWRS